MPIQEADPWRMQYFEHADCPADIHIPTVLAGDLKPIGKFRRFDGFVP